MSYIHPGQTVTSVTTDPHAPNRSNSVPQDRIRAGKRKVSVPVCAHDQDDNSAAESANAGRSRRSGKTTRRTTRAPAALPTAESTPPTSNSAAKRKATSVMSEDDSDYVDSSEDEHTHFFIQNSL